MMNYLRRLRVRWALLVYDLILFMGTIFIFLFIYRGGGILSTSESIVHTVIALITIFGTRILTGVYSQVWRYGGVQAYLLLIFSDTVAMLLYMLFNIVLPIETIAMSRVISITSFNTMLALSLRMCYRYAYKCGNDTGKWGRFLNLLITIFAGRRILSQRKDSNRRRPVAIIGAGRVGVSLAEELLNNPGSQLEPVCFVDSSRAKSGRTIRSIPVIAEMEVTKEQFRSLDVEQIIFAVPNLDVNQKKALYEHYRDWGFPIKIYDYPIMEAAGGKRSLRNFDIEEVLFRPALTVMNEATRTYYSGKVILVTGGGGSIGSELARQAAKMKPKKLILLDIYENGVYDLQQELKMLYGNQLEVAVEIASITNRAALARVFETYHPDIVINAAAHKHVPLMEHNVVEAVENNVFGMINVLELCEKYGTGRFMQLSTDKAVNPTNVMGATKRLCELVMETFSTRGTVRCSATRFGNVLGSAGSVIPLFRRQISAGGPVTLTDKRIIRYFMTIPEASQLVLQSGAMAENGELFVLDMGEPVKILDLAENMIRLSGYLPYQDIDIVEIGLRPGEKLYEELLISSEELDRTENSMIFIERDQPVSVEKLKELIAALKDACETGDDAQVRSALEAAVPTFHRPEEVNQSFRGRVELPKEVG